MIKPTLFIGLGTTGAKILKTLRQLMSEEFKNSGLPVFRYVAIETMEEETGDNSRQSEDYEQITVVNATIGDTTPIRKRLDSNQPRNVYNPHLTDWLNPGLLNQIQSFKDGASNIRMAGRLCLWENWVDILSTLSRARNDIIDPAKRESTLETLTKHYEAKNLNPPAQLMDQDGINAYIVGTLCGGSCSGMLIDIAYFLRYLLGGDSNNNIYGIFTMFDRILAGSNAEDIAVHAANCYASLSELNYYNYLDTVYDVTFPTNQRIETTQKPFDYAMLVSPTGELANIRFVSGGTVDEDGMNLMVALNLFAETAGDTDGQKEGIRTDWVQYGGYGGLKPVPVGETPTMVKSLASFGLTAVWYPKYRIANAAACSASETLCKNWSNSHTDNAVIRAAAKQEWNGIRGNAQILTSPEVEGQPALKDHIESLLNQADRVFNRQTSANALRQEMNTFPKGQTTSLSAMFARGGRYYNWVQSKVDNCKETFSAAITRSLRDQLVKVNFEGTYGLGDVRTFFEELDLIIEQALQQCPDQLNSLDLDKLNFEPMRRAETNPWLKITGVKEEAINTHRGRLISEHRQLIAGEQRSIYRNVRDYFLRQVLENVREKLGFKVHSDGPTIRQQLDRIAVNLDRCSETLAANYESDIKAPRYECVKIVTNNPQNSIQIDAEALSSQIADAVTPAALLVEDDQQITMDVFLKKSSGDLRLHMTETYRRSALSLINEETEDDRASALVVTKAQALLDAAGDDIKELVRRSNPYQEFTSEYQPFHLENGTKIIFGHDPTDGHPRLNDLKTRLDFERSGNSSVDHLLFFYEEEASFALDDLAAYEPLKQHFESGPGVYGHWTHKDPNFYDLKLHPKSLKLERWCRALTHLVPEIRQQSQTVFNDIFEYQDDTVIFTYKDEVGLDKPLRLSDDEQGIKELCRQENEGAYNNFFSSIQEEFNKLKSQDVKDLVNEMIRQITNPNERRNLGDFYGLFLTEVYSDGDVNNGISLGLKPTTASSSSGSDSVNPEPFNKEPGIGLTVEELERIQQVLRTPMEEWSESDRGLMSGFTLVEFSLIHQILEKPVVDWTEEDQRLMKRFKQNSEQTDSEETSIDGNDFVRQGTTERKVYS